MIVHGKKKKSNLIVIQLFLHFAIFIFVLFCRFSETHADGKLYDVKFRAQKDHNYPRRCAHYALSLMHSRNTLTFLFPLKSKSFVQDKLIGHRWKFFSFSICSISISICNEYNSTVEYLRNDKPINPDISYNPEQKQAVLKIVNKSSHPAPYILYGPPGTGKTATLVEAICQVYRSIKWKFFNSFFANYNYTHIFSCLVILQAVMC